MRLNQKFSLLLVIALATILLSAGPLQAAIGRRASLVLQESVLQETTLLANTWSNLWDRLRRKEVPGGSRGELGQPTVCAVVPGTLSDQNSDEVSSLQVWDLNPVFVWQGEWSQLEVLHSRTHEVLLSQALTPEARHLVYGDVEGAVSLEPGGAYYWKLSRKASGDDPATFGETSFRTLDEEKRLALEAELANVLNSANTPEQALSKRVNFWADQELWADVFRELHNANELPAELETLKGEIADHDFCKQRPEVLQES
ncbi:MAG: hypothetical protein ABG776_20770 [Cyanobacteria bacterium J06555_13]